ASVCCTLIVPLQTRPPPTHTLFPYTTLFRSMLELYLEEPHHVDGETGDTGNGDPRRPVGREDLADSAMGHEMPLGGSTVARHHQDRKSTRLNSSHVKISYAVFCLKKKRNAIH